jgi:hypothetical protein
MRQTMDALKPGSIILFRGQPYRCLEVVQCVTRQGEPSIYLRWQSMCADCGTTFETTTSRVPLDLTRRCKACKAPGRKVSKQVIVVPSHGDQ